MYFLVRSNLLGYLLWIQSVVELPLLPTSSDMLKSLNPKNYSRLMIVNVYVHVWLTRKNETVLPPFNAPYLILVCFAKSSALSIGESIRSTVKKAARLAVYDEIIIKVKNHHMPATTLEVLCFIWGFTNKLNSSNSPSWHSSEWNESMKHRFVSVGEIFVIYLVDMLTISLKKAPVSDALQEIHPTQHSKKDLLSKSHFLSAKSCIFMNVSTLYTHISVLFDKR